jgi:hypothetical protein
MNSAVQFSPSITKVLWLSPLLLQVCGPHFEVGPLNSDLNASWSSGTHIVDHGHWVRQVLSNAINGVHHCLCGVSVRGAAGIWPTQDLLLALHNCTVVVVWYLIYLHLKVCT